MNIPEIDAPEALEYLEAKSAVFIDVRDAQSFGVARIPGAVRPVDSTIGEFIADTPKDQKLIVYCYHGNMSRGATAYFLEQGFTDVASMRGGFEDWRHQYPIDDSTPA